MSKKIRYVTDDEMQNVNEDILKENFEYANDDSIPLEIEDAYCEHMESMNYDEE